MQQRRDVAVRSIKLMMAMSILGPLCLLAYASWINYQSTFRQADERIKSRLDIISEYTVKVFQTVNVTLISVNEFIRNKSDDEIRASKNILQPRLLEISDALEAVDSIWVFDKNGRALVSSEANPIPNDISVTDRNYFKAHVERDAGTFIGQILSSKALGKPFFAVSRRRETVGDFNGIIELSITPDDFANFFERLGRDAGAFYTLIRADGFVLARFPSVSQQIKFTSASGFMKAIANNPEGGIYTTRSEIDGIDRRIGLRKIPNLPLYVNTGLELNGLRAEWLWTMANHLIFGIPATAFLFTLSLLTLRRTQNFYSEAARREEAEKSLRQAQKMEAVGQLTGGVAHDFNNLLTIIIGNLGIAKRGVVEARAQRALDHALIGAERAAELTQRLLAFSRKQALNPKPIDSNKMIAGMADLLQRSLGEKVDLQFVGGAGLWKTEADPSELEAALLNLAVNARDAMPNGGKLTIETSNAFLDEEYCRSFDDVESGQYVLISVTDNGRGMTAETREKAFEPFFTTKPAGEGTGLGLSQVYGFVKQSGGHVRIYSELDEGTTIKIYLSRYLGTESVEPAIEMINPQKGRGETVLVVEDDAGVRQYVAEILRDFNYQVLEAKDGEDALRLTSANRSFDLLLTDVVLPGKNGRELVEEIKKTRPDLLVIFMTGYSRNAIVHQGRLDAGVVFIQKPLTERMLALKIREVLDGARDLNGKA